MNFPDLETCRAIGDEFPGSEFMWMKFIGEPWDVYPRSKLESFKSALEEESIQSPTCEELGEWLRCYYSKALLTKPKEYLVKIQKLFFSCAMSEQETQARADAVALALKENQK